MLVYQKSKKVGVIGTGPSGLIVIKEFLEQGHEVLAFEAQDTIGGVFANNYNGLKLTTSSLNTSFGAYSNGRERTPTMWSAQQYLEYLKEFAEHFGINQHIRFKTPVKSIKRDAASNTWTIETNDGEETGFDHIAVCAGLNQGERMPPQWPGSDRFKGKIIHSGRYKKAEDFAQRKVLIVGLGESGSDISLQLAKVAETTAISTRKGPGYVIPRFLGGMPTDIDTNRCYHAIPYWITESALFRLKVRLESLYQKPEDDRQLLRTVTSINKKSGYSPFRRFGTKNASFVEALLYHDTEYHPDIKKLEPDGVRFVDGSFYSCDTIICCTGFKNTFPIFEAHHPELVEMGSSSRTLYKRMFSPEIGNELAWIGFVRPGIGSIPPCSEMQARYFALVVSGIRELPTVEVMRQEIEQQAVLDVTQYPRDAQRLSPLTDYLRFQESMAEVIGCAPPLAKMLFNEPRIGAKVLFGPFTGLQYRLTGPGAMPEKARAALRRLPTMPWSVLFYEFLFLLGSKILHRLGLGEKFKPTGF